MNNDDSNGYSAEASVDREECDMAIGDEGDASTDERHDNGARSTRSMSSPIARSNRSLCVGCFCLSRCDICPVDACLMGDEDGRDIGETIGVVVGVGTWMFTV